jgi:hypothetical protein
MMNPGRHGAARAENEVPTKENTMAEVKVITIQAGEDFLASLTKLLGSDVAAAVDSAVKQAGVDVATGTVSAAPAPAVESYEPDEDEVDEDEISDEDQAFVDSFDEDGDEDAVEGECEVCEHCGAIQSSEDEAEAPAFGEVSEEGLVESEDCFTKYYSVVDADRLDVKVTPTGVVVDGDNLAGETFEDTIAPYGAYDEVTAFFDSDNEVLEVVLWKVTPEGVEVVIEGW